MRDSAPPPRFSVAETVARAAYETALILNAKGIVTPTITGTTARLISKYRPEQPILAVTPEDRALRSMLLDWGVFPSLTRMAEDSNEMIQNAQKIAFDTGLAGISDKLVLAAGLPIESPLPLNTVRVLILGNVLARGGSGGFADESRHQVSGSIFRADSGEEAEEIVKLGGGDILLCPVLTDAYIPVLKTIKGVICEGSSRIGDEALPRINPRLVWLTGVHSASVNLESGLLVTLDGKALLVYEGLV
jgi:pyruvate kinase